MAVITIDGTRLEVPEIKMYWNVRWKPEFIFRTSAIIRICRRMVPAACVL